MTLLQRMYFLRTSPPENIGSGEYRRTDIPEVGESDTDESIPCGTTHIKKFHGSIVPLSR